MCGLARIVFSIYRENEYIPSILKKQKIYHHFLFKYLYITVLQPKPIHFAARSVHVYILNHE